MTCSVMDRTGTSHSVMLVYTSTRFLLETRIGKPELPSDLTQRVAVEREIQQLMAQQMIDDNEGAVGISAQRGATLSRCCSRA